MKLYGWLEPVHLNVTQEICNKEIEKAVNQIKLVEKQLCVSEMISKYIEAVSLIYKAIGINCDHSTFFSIFVLVVLKSQSSSLNYVINFIEKFRRNQFPRCESKCTHGILMFSTCDCLRHEQCEESEVDYYLIVFKAALEFIEKVEFYDLNVPLEEFNLRCCK